MKVKVLFLTNNDNSMVLYHWLAEREEVVRCSDPLNLEMVKNIRPEIIVSYNYKYILSSEVIDYMEGKIYNLHISLLPWNRGSNPNYWSFVENTPKGVTIHQINAGLDTGEMIAQEEMFFDEKEESFSSTYKKLNDKIVELFMQNWMDIKNGSYKLTRQQGKGSYHTVKDFRRFTEKNPVDW
ncbi:MAG: formyl transferase, partial [Lachnospiraceae bacterium]|nr:formyl transferase [Lachnospiraceae bacterium]